MADFVHQPPRVSIYVPNEYNANLNMTIPYALARGFFGYINAHPMRYSQPPRPLYIPNRAPIATPIVTARTYLPKGAHLPNMPPPLK